METHIIVKAPLNTAFQDKATFEPAQLPYKARQLLAKQGKPPIKKPPPRLPPTPKETPQSMLVQSGGDGAIHQNGGTYEGARGGGRP